MRKYRKKEGVFMFNKDKPTKEPQERRYQTQDELERKISHGQYCSDCKTSKCGHGSGIRYV